MRHKPTEAEIEQRKRFLSDKLSALGRIRDNPKVRPAAFRLAHLIVDKYLNKKSGVAFVGQKKLAGKLDVSIRQIQRFTRQLVQAGEIQVTASNGPGMANRYRVVGLKGINEAETADIQLEINDPLGEHNQKLATKKVVINDDLKGRPYPVSLPCEKKVSKKASKQAAAVDSDSERFRPVDNFKESHPGAGFKESAEAPRPGAESDSRDGSEAIGLPPEWTSRPSPPLPPKRPEPPPGFGRLPDGPAVMSSEEKFWSLQAQAEAKGISKSQVTSLLKATQDFDAALIVLQRAMKKARNPADYLAVAIRGIWADESGYAPPPVTPQPTDEPRIAREARVYGIPVRRVVRSNGKPGWWVMGALYNANGDQIGN